MRITLARVSTPDLDGDGRGGSGRVGPALLGQGGSSQSDRGDAGDVAEPVVGEVAAMVVAAGDEDRPPASSGLLEVLDRDQLAAARDRRVLALHPAAQPQDLAGP